MNEFEFFTPAEVAKFLKVSVDTVIRQFADVPGVIDLGVGERLHKRQKRLLRIPYSALKVYVERHAA